MRLLDTDVMIDILRGYLPAVNWLAGLLEVPGLPGFVVMELISGCPNKAEVKKLQKSLNLFQIYWPTENDCNRALDVFVKYKLNNGLGIMDALIGECAVGLGATLSTFNLKHFKVIPSLKTEQPYTKS